jgi:hypothetical protein
MACFCRMSHTVSVDGRCWRQSSKRIQGENFRIVNPQTVNVPASSTTPVSSGGTAVVRDHGKSHELDEADGAASRESGF